MLTKESLNDRLTQPCSCGCGKILGSELWLHPHCHSSSGLKIEFRQPQVMTISCITCGSKVCDIATEEASATFFKKCHRKAPLWAKYEGGFIKVYCRVCNTFIKKVRVASSPTDSLISCGDHQASPCCIVCSHLVDGTSYQWERIPMGGDVPDDWLCPACAAKWPDVPLADLHSLCIYCVQELQRKSAQGSGEANGNTRRSSND